MAGAHPLARIAAAAIVMLALFAVLDARGSVIALAAIAIFTWMSGIRFRDVARRALPLALAAIGVGVFNGLLAEDPMTGLAVALRLTGIALAGIVAVATIRPTELADALVQHLRAPARFAVGALAAFRMLPLFTREWKVRGMARRARGFDSDRGLGQLAAFPQRTHALLVGAIRRAVTLALAMDARGFGSRPCRTLSRPRGFAGADLVLVAVAGVVAILVVVSARA